MPIFVIEPTDTQDDEPRVDPEGAKPLGQAAGVHWYKDTVIPPEGREPTTPEWQAAMLELPSIRSLKQSARRRIELEVGDLHEIIADQARQIEALTALGARIAADYLGGTAMSGETKADYLGRVENIIAGIDGGSLKLRGDEAGAEDMLTKVLSRTSRINEIIAEEYLPRRNEVLS